MHLAKVWTNSARVLSSKWPSSSILEIILYLLTWSIFDLQIKDGRRKKQSLIKELDVHVYVVRS